MYEVNYKMQKLYKLWAHVKIIQKIKDAIYKIITWKK